MKKIVFTVLFVALLVSASGADEGGSFFDNENVREKLSLTDGEVEDLKSLWDRMQKEIMIVSADKEIKMAELKRLLLEENVDMKAVEKTLRESMDFEYKTRLAEIKRAVGARKILGEQRWAELNRMLRMFKEKHLKKMRDNRKLPHKGMSGNK